MTKAQKYIINSLKEGQRLIQFGYSLNMSMLYNTDTLQGRSAGEKVNLKIVNALVDKNLIELKELKGKEYKEYMLV